ncbi:MAG: hypothetical protein WCI18_01560 [Pseudomonadota bacterium]
MLRHVIFLCFLQIALREPVFALELKPTDIALVMPKEHVGLDSQTGLLKESWYNQVKKSFKNTSVGDAVDIENVFSDWQLISVRVVPCSPLGVSPLQQIDLYCWPEIRLVWQPILLQRNPGREPNYADDRAIHVLYDIDPSLYLSSAPAELSVKIKEGISQSLLRGQVPVVSESELKAFYAVRNRVTRLFLEEALALRNSSPIDKVEVRSEFQSQSTAKPFLNSLKAFLSRHANPKNVKTLTSFSLPEGRDPATVDEWVFLKFSGKDGEIQPTKISLFSAVTAKPLFDFGFAPRGTMLRDEPSLYDWLDRNPNDEILKNVMVFGDRFTHSQIADRTKILVDNTSCASCHKLQSEKFNFHALSYVGKDDLAVSPRVVQDVNLDLKWIGGNLTP